MWSSRDSSAGTSEKADMAVGHNRCKYSQKNTCREDVSRHNRKDATTAGSLDPRSSELYRIPVRLPQHGRGVAQEGIYASRASSVVTVLFMAVKACLMSTVHAARFFNLTGSTSLVQAQARGRLVACRVTHEVSGVTSCISDLYIREVQHMYGLLTHPMLKMTAIKNRAIFQCSLVWLSHGSRRHHTREGLTSGAQVRLRPSTQTCYEIWETVSISNHWRPKHSQHQGSASLTAGQQGVDALCHGLDFVAIIDHGRGDTNGRIANLGLTPELLSVTSPKCLKTVTDCDVEVDLGTASQSCHFLLWCSGDPSTTRVSTPWSARICLRTWYFVCVTACMGEP